MFFFGRLSLTCYIIINGEKRVNKMVYTVHQGPNHNPWHTDCEKNSKVVQSAQEEEDREELAAAAAAIGSLPPPSHQGQECPTTMNNSWCLHQELIPSLLCKSDPVVTHHAT